MSEAVSTGETAAVAAEQKPNPWKEIVQPFVDVWHAPRALWGVNLGYMLEGLAYFGVLGYLAIYFSQQVFAGVANPDTYAHDMVAVLTGGITIAMLFLGFVPDKVGVRRALIWSFVLLVIGRVCIAGAPTILHLRAGLWSPLHLATMIGIIIVVIGYGMYQPAAYAAVRQFTSPTTSGMAYAMLYALMNLGGWFPTFAFLLRDQKFLGLGIVGTFWFYVGVTVLALVSTVVLLTSGTVQKAIARAKEDTAREQGEAAAASEKAGEKPAGAVVKGVTGRYPPVQMWILVAGLVAATWIKIPAAPALAGLPLNVAISALVVLVWVALALLPSSGRFLARHPLADVKFFFFIFALIPVQTLFTYNWLVLPEYINRAYTGWVGKYFEVASNFNPILIFILTPVIAALTLKRKVYNMMIWGTFVMGAPAFLLALGPSPLTLYAYLILMTVGEAMWSPRFLQYAAEIAPEGRTGEYMGVAQLPWFLTKVLVPLLYSGYMMDRYCPAPETGRPVHTEPMWLIFGCIAMGSFVLLVLAKNWVGKDFKTKAAERGPRAGPTATTGGRDVTTTDATGAPVGAFHPSRALYRWIVLILAGILTFGSYFAYDSIGALVDTLLKAWHTNRQAIGGLYTLYSVAAIVVVFLGGMLIDRIGTRRASLVFSILVVIGACIVAFARGVVMAGVGRLVFGAGSESLVVAQSAILSRWFRGKELAFSFGFTLMIARLGTLFSFNTEELLAGRFGWQSALWVAAALCALSLVANLVYFAMDKAAERPLKLEEGGAGDKIVFADVAKFHSSYWYAVALCVTWYSAIFPFTALSTDLFHEKWGLPLTAGSAGGFLQGVFVNLLHMFDTAPGTSSIIIFGSLCLAAFAGWLVDRIGRRASIMIFGAVLMIPCYLILAFTMIPPRYPMFLLGASFVLVPAAIWPSIPLIVEKNRVGTAFGLMTMIQNIGLGLFPFLNGWLRDRTHGYTASMVMFASLGLVGLVFAILLKRSDVRHGNVLDHTRAGVAPAA